MAEYLPGPLSSTTKPLRAKSVHLKPFIQQSVPPQSCYTSVCGRRTVFGKPSGEVLRSLYFPDKLYPLHQSRSSPIHGGRARDPSVSSALPTSRYKGTLPKIPALFRSLEMSWILREENCSSFCRSRLWRHRAKSWSQPV